MRDAEIAERLRSRNPWWRHPRGRQAEDPNLREAAEAPFEYRPQALEDLRAGGLYTLSGPRNVLDTDGDVWAVPAGVIAWLLGT